MKCPSCAQDLIEKKHENFQILSCLQCSGMFIMREELKKIETSADPFLSWINFDLWKHHPSHDILHGDRYCPSCANNFHTLSYPDSDIRIDVCHPCQAVWINPDMLSRFHNYLEEKISNESIAEYVKDFGHELVEVIAGKEKARNLGILLKLLHFRIFAQWSFIEKLIESLPKL